MADEAVTRFHATAAEAAAVARESEVQQLILTHISPRYTDTAAMLAEAREVFAQTELAEDFACFDVVRSVYSRGSEFSSAGSS